MLSPDYQTPERMALKRQAIPLPDLARKRVLDVGCDMGAWTRLAHERGAVDVLGLDRNREVRGEWVDLVTLNRLNAPAGVRFAKCNLGKQWPEFGRFDVILMFSMYHHWYENCGDHRPIWFWLWRHLHPAGELLFEGPVDDRDPVVRKNVSDANRPGFRLDAILAAASFYFAAEKVGPALHAPTREVWRFRPHTVIRREHVGAVQAGAGGATRAFLHADSRRMDEVERILGWRPIPGSLNVMLREPFGWDDGYYRAQVLDVVDRSKGLDSDWAPRWARFYPVNAAGEEAIAFRFEGERYDARFLELIAPWRIRDMLEALGHDKIMVRRP